MGGRDELRRGWGLILAAATGVGFGVTGLVFYSFGLFVKPLSAAHGWSRGQTSLGVTCVTLGVVLTAPGVGWLVDRFGARRVAAPSLVGLALGWVLLARSGPDLLSFYGACFAMAVLGGATSPLAFTRVVSLSFERVRGLALGLTLLGTALASLLGAPLVGLAVARAGVSGACLACGAATLLLAAPLTLLLLKPPRSGGAAPAEPRAGLGFGQAVRSPAFWILGAATAISLAAQSGTMVHLEPLLSDRGATPEAAAALAGNLGIGVALGRFGFAALLDRFAPARVAALALLAPAAAALALLVLPRGSPLLPGAVVLLGLGAGGEVDFLAFFTARLFGLRAYGRIYGALSILFSGGVGLGPPVVGFLFDRFGGYGPGLAAAAAAFLISGALFAGLGRFPPHAADPARARTRRPREEFAAG